MEKEFSRPHRARTEQAASSFGLCSGSGAARERFWEALIPAA